LRWPKLAISWMAAQLAPWQTGPTTIITFAILFGGILTAAAIPMGLGARDLARDLLQSQFRPKVRPVAGEATCRQRLAREQL
jgi:hypothetical protein